MKKLFISLIFAVFVLSGCSDIGNATEIGSRAIIQAAAVDYNNGYRVSALLFSSGGSGGDTIDASQENVIKVTGEGDTLSEAIDNISLVDGKRIYMCETKLLILGSGFETESLTNVLNTLYYDMRCSLNMPVCCADLAESLTDIQFKEGITSAEKPLSLIENAYEMGSAPKTTLLDLMSDIRAGRDTLVPLLEITENGRGMTSSDTGETAVIGGSRDVRQGFLCESYDKTATASLMLWRGLSDRIILNYTHNGEEHSCVAYRIKVKLMDKTQTSTSLEISAKFRSRSGGSITEEERKSAIRSLAVLLENVV